MNKENKNIVVEADAVEVEAEETVVEKRGFLKRMTDGCKSFKESHDTLVSNHPSIKVIENIGKIAGAIGLVAIGVKIGKNLMIDSEISDIVEDTVEEVIDVVGDIVEETN